MTQKNSKITIKILIFRFSELEWNSLSRRAPLRFVPPVCTSSLVSLALHDTIIKLSNAWLDWFCNPFVRFILRSKHAFNLNFLGYPRRRWIWRASRFQRHWRRHRSRLQSEPNLILQSRNLSHRTNPSHKTSAFPLASTQALWPWLPSNFRRRNYFSILQK